MTEVGFGRRVITPPLPVALAGFSGRSGPAEVVIDDLEVRVFFARTGDVALCLVVCDLLGMSPEFANPIRRSVADTLGVSIDAVLTACVHVHAGPSTMKGGEILGWPTPDGYLELLVDACLDAATQAQTSVQRATFHFARSPLPEHLSVNRRQLPYAPDFAVLDIRSTDGTRIGTIANVSIHPVARGIGSLAVSTDWVGPFRNAHEAMSHGTTILLSGALGDVNPPVLDPTADLYDSANFADADQLGRDVAAVVADALRTTTQVDDAVRVRSRQTIEVEPTGGLAALAGLSGPTAVELVEWMLGDVRLVSVPGEAFHALGKRIVDAKGERLLLAGLSPVWQGYLPDPWGEGYEEGVSYGEAAVAAMRVALVEDVDE